MAINKRQVQEINAGSMADIAFLLLIFFLVATTMNVDTGIQRVLPAIPPKDQQENKINERNVLMVFVNNRDLISVSDQVTGMQYIDITQLKDRAKEFVLNRANNEKLPAKTETVFDEIGTYPVSEGVISLQNDRGTSYRIYVMVQNELTRAFNEIRDELSQEKFGRKFGELTKERQKIIQEAVPLKISEQEPRNIGGN